MPEVDEFPFGVRELLGLIYPVDLAPQAFLGTTLIGLVAVALVFAALRDRRNRPEVMALLGLALLSLWLAFGPALKLNSLLRVVFPPWRYLRYPIKASVVAFLTLPVAAGFGVEPMRAGAVRARAALAWVVLGIAGLCSPDLRTWTMASWWLASAACLMLLALERTDWRCLGVALVGLVQLSIVLPQVRLTSDQFYQPSPVVQIMQRSGVELVGGSFSRQTRAPPDPLEEPAAFAAAGGGGGGAYGSLFGLPSWASTPPGAPGASGGSSRGSGLRLRCR